MHFETWQTHVAFFPSRENYLPSCLSQCLCWASKTRWEDKILHLPVKRLDVSFWPQGPKSSDLKNTLLKGNKFFSQHRISRKSAFTWCLHDIFIHIKFIIFQAHLKSCQQTPKSRNLWHDPLKSPWTFQVWVTFQLPQVPHIHGWKKKSDSTDF